MNVPILRRTVRDVTGAIITSPSLAAQFNQMVMWNRRLGRSFGMEECLDFKILRRTHPAEIAYSLPPSTLPGSHIRVQRCRSI
jgi:hypothetical protein